MISKKNVRPQLVSAARATSHACATAATTPEASHQSHSRSSDGTRPLEPQASAIPSSAAADDDTQSQMGDGIGGGAEAVGSGFSGSITNLACCSCHDVCKEYIPGAAGIVRDTFPHQETY